MPRKDSLNGMVIDLQFLPDSPYDLQHLKVSPCHSVLPKNSFRLTRSSVLIYATATVTGDQIN